MVKFMNENNYEKLNELIEEVEEELENKFYDKYDALEWLVKNGYVEKKEVTYNQYSTKGGTYLGDDDDYEDCMDVYEALLDWLEYDELESILYDLKKQEQEGE